MPGLRRGRTPPPARLAAAAPLSNEEARRLLEPVLAGASRALIAVSGGPDSVALMRLCAALAREGLACAFEAATVDHGLREGSHEEARGVGRWARQCGLKHRVLAWEGIKPATRIQERAREARYALLAARARQSGATLILTAHTQDDQAETVLMRMAHGTGLAGLAGMRAVSSRDGIELARPLLGVPKARLVATCEANGWPFVEDPSNADPRFARARWRKLATALAAEGLTARRLAQIAERAALADAALEAKATEAYALARLARGPEGLKLDARRLMQEPREIALRLLRRALAELHQGSAIPFRLERAEALLDALDEALAEGRRMRRTLANALVALDRNGALSLGPEGPRRRGARAAKGAEGPVKRPLAKKGNSNAALPLV